MTGSGGDAIRMTAACAPASLVDLLRLRARDQSDDVAFIFLRDGESEQARLTYGQLECRARAIAVQVRRTCAAGSRALLLYPSGLEYICGFFGCLFAGVIAVPVYPPTTQRNRWQRLDGIVQDCGATCVLGDRQTLDELAEVAAASTQWSRLQQLATDEVADSDAADWAVPAIDDATIAFLQYTSGSTGDAKGVSVSHANLLHNEALICEGFGTDRDTVVVGWLPLYHDMGLIGNVLHPLYIGAKAILMSPMAFLQQPLRWLRAIAEYRGTVSGGPNFAYELCAERATSENLRGLDLRHWRVAFNGAEPIRADTLNRFAAAFRDCGFRESAFFPCYGLAEATLFASGADPVAAPVLLDADAMALREDRFSPATDEPGCRLVSSGHADAARMCIVDPSAFRCLAEDKIGEIWLCGASIAQGYWQRPEANAEIFHACTADGGGPFLRTGDLGFVHAGQLYVTGRLKELIIIRGRNHYPQDIEKTVQDCDPAFRAGAGAAFAIERDGEERVVVVQEVRRDKLRRLDARQLESAVRAALSSTHELQLHDLVLIKPMRLPKTSSGKIQRYKARELYMAGALHAMRVNPADAGPQEVRPIRAPRGALEARVAALWSDVFRRPRVDIDDDFFECGGDSLLATRLMARVRSEFAVDLPVTALFEARTVAALAQRVAVASPAASPPPTPVPRDAPLPLSHAQQRLWFLDQLEGPGANYNMSAAFRLRGPLDVHALRASLGEIVRRHEILRTRFVEGDSGPAQEVVEAADFSLPVVEVDGAALARHLHICAQQPFDLRAGGLLRATLLQMGPQNHVLHVAMHHIVGDGWSIGVLVRELNALYSSAVRGESAALQPLPLQYADYAVWQRRCLQGPALERQLAYWRTQLADLPPLLEIPGDRPRPPVPSLRAGVHHFHVSAALRRRLEEFSRNHGTTLLAALAAGFELLLARHSGQTDIAIGMPAANRDHAEVQDLIGFFVNTVVLRNHVRPEMTFVELLDQVRTNILAAQEHQDLPFEQLVEELKPTRSMSHTPLIQVMLLLQDGAINALSLPNLAIERIDDGHAVARFDLALNIEPQADGLHAWLDYAADLFSPQRIARLAEHYLRLLEAALDNSHCPVSRLALLDATEIAWQLEPQHVLTAQVQSAVCVHTLIERQAQATPHALAIVFERAGLSYADLESRANRLAHCLRHRDVGAEDHVGVWMERSPDLLVAMLAIWKCGGIYVPLDPGYPQERLDYIVTDAQLRCIVADSKLAQRSPCPAAPCVYLDHLDNELAEMPDTRPRIDVHPLQPAYVIYTSGSTGQPKGVQVLHAGLADLLLGLKRRFDVRGSDSMLSVASQAFGIAFVELLLPLIAGGHTSIVRKERVLDTESLVESLRGVTLAHLVPSLMRRVVAHLAETKARPAPGTLRHVFVGGDAVAPALLSDMAVAYPDVAIVEFYGQTETTILSTHAPQAGAARAGNIIGTRLDHAQVYVLAADLQLLPQGSVGEICVAGHGIARGYLDQPQQTADRFVPHPFSREPGARLYRTGDLGRLLTDGAIEYVGRADFQVNIRGFRVELGEIESALRTHPHVQGVVVAARDDARGEKCLVAYLVPVSAGTVDVAALRARLRDALPDYMMPAHFLVLDAFPLNANGKLDRRALPAPDPRESMRVYVAPRNETECEVAELWAEVLSLPRVGIHDNFFELGGHSLLAAQAMTRARRRFGVALSVADFFEAQTVADFAARLAAARREQELVARLTTAPPGDSEELESFVL